MHKTLGRLGGVSGERVGRVGRGHGSGVKGWAGSPSPTLPNFAQLILGPGQGLQGDEVVTYGNTVGVHLRRRGGQRKVEHTQHITRQHQRKQREIR